MMCLHNSRDDGFTLVLRKMNRYGAEGACAALSPSFAQPTYQEIPNR